MLDELGFDPESDPGAERPEGGATQISLRNCPFLELAGERPHIACSIHMGLMQGAMGAWRSPVTVDRLAAFVEPDRCVAHLVRDNGSSVAAELTAMLRVSPAAISAAVGYLQTQELISREIDEPRRRDRYIIDEAAWVRAAVAGARQNAAIADAARTSAAEIGITTAAGERLVGVAEFLDRVSRDTATLCPYRSGRGPPERGALLASCPHRAQ